MSNKTTLQNNNGRISRNNNDLNTILQMASTINNMQPSEDLTSEFNSYETALTTQETTIDDIMNALQGKAAGGGEEITLQEKYVEPTTSYQTVVADPGYNGLSEITIYPVTSSIDSDIKAANIKSGVNILGVNGTLEAKEDLSSELTNQNGLLTTQETTIDDIMSALQGKAAAGGSKLLSGGKLKWVFTSYDSATYCYFWGSLELEKTYEIYAVYPGNEDILVLSFIPTLLEGQNMGYTFNYIGYQGESLFGSVKIQDSLTYVGNIPDESFASMAISAICVNFISSDGTDYSEDFNTFYWYIKEM